jgi:hypothetical protein
MISRTSLVTLAVWLAAGSLCFGSAFDGTWKLNAKKSHLGRGMGRNSTVKYDGAFLFRNKVTIDGTDAKGKAEHSEWVGAFDGRDYAVAGDPESDMRSYNKVDDHTLNFWVKKGGHVMASGKIVVSADGNTRTVTTMSKNKRGRMVRTTAVYDKVGG